MQKFITSKGRIDAVVTTETYIYIFEFKVRGTAQEALEQIKNRKYYQKYNNQRLSNRAYWSSSL